MFEFRGYAIRRKDYTAGRFLVEQNIPFNDLHITSNLQAVAVRILSQPRPFKLCSLFLPPGRLFSAQQLKDLLHSLPPPVILAGDFNSHNIIWGSDHVDERGKLVESFIDNCNLNIINNPIYQTHLCARSGKLSAIDLTITSPLLQATTQWYTLDDTHGSDHFPIIIKTLNKCLSFSRHNKWLIRKADWPQYQAAAKLSDIGLILTLTT
nr:uncharacterized protein LOC112211036 [Halyomorpha halys]